MVKVILLSLAALGCASEVLWIRRISPGISYSAPIAVQLRELRLEAGRSYTLEACNCGSLRLLEAFVGRVQRQGDTLLAGERKLSTPLGWGDQRCVGMRVYPEQTGLHTFLFQRSPCVDRIRVVAK